MASTMDSLFEKLEAILENAVKAGIPGVTAALSNSSGIIWESQAGNADIQTQKPMDKTHLFGVGSITKVFVTVVVLQLVEERVLKMTDTPGSILEASVLKGIPNAATATISQLTSHTSGIPSWEDDPKWIREGRGVDVDPSRIWGKLDTLEYIRKSLDEDNSSNLNATKEFPFSYSNSNFTLLGLMIEKVTRNTAESEIRRRILEPLGLTSTYLEGFETPQLHRLPHRYHYATPTFREVAGISPYFPEVRPGLIDASSSNLSVEWTAGGLLSSPQDISKFALALKNGELLQEKSMAVLQDWKPIGPDVFMGHGLFRFKRRQGFACGHSGSTLGFTGCFVWIEDADFAITVGANVGTMHAGEDIPGVSNVMKELLDLNFEGLKRR